MNFLVSSAAVFVSVSAPVTVVIGSMSQIVAQHAVMWPKRATLNPPNRHMRTRMYGGEGGEDGRTLTEMKCPKCSAIFVAGVPEKS